MAARQHFFKGVKARLDLAWQRNPAIEVDLAFAVICLLAVAVSIAFLGPLKISVKLGPLLVKGCWPLLLLIIITFSIRRTPGIARIARVAFWAIIFTNVFMLPIYFGIRLHTPFADALLASLDHRLGVEVPKVIEYIKMLPGLDIFLEHVYDSLVFLMAFALMLPPALGQADKSNELLLAIVLSVLATFPIMYFIQAIGPWVEYRQINASAVQRHAAGMLQFIKSGKPLVFDPGHIDPLLAIPSWHTIFAILSALALIRVPILRWFAIIWAVAVTVSCVTTGWHYVVDVLAGLFLALLAWGVSGALLRWRRNAALDQENP